MGNQQLYSYSLAERDKLAGLGNFQLVLSGASTAASQQPSVTDTPITIEFGPLQTETDVDISATGVLTFNTSGCYRITFVIHYGRTGAGGVSILFIRGRLNGSQYGMSEAVHIDNAEIVIPSAVTFDIDVVATDTFDVQLYRDSDGNNSGGIFKTVSTLGWDDAPCGFIAVRKQVL